MKQLNIALTFPLKIRKLKFNKSNWFTIPLGILTTLFLLSFTFSSFSNNSSLLPFFDSEVPNNAGKISLTVNSSLLEGSTVQEAILYREEQFEGIFSKNLNISLSDDNGNLVGISLTDLKTDSSNDCLSEGNYYGLEDEETHKNYSLDLGEITFSNSCSLILEGKNGNSIISRSGWIKIDSCDSKGISGNFHFKIGEADNYKISSGFFKNVEIKIEG